MIDYRLEGITDKDISFVVISLNDPILYRLVRGPINKEVTPESIKYEMNLPGGWWIIWVNHDRVGWVRLSIRDVWSVSLGIVIVDPEYRHKELGDDICWHMLYDMAFPLFKEVYWTTWMYNIASLKLAYKLGFVPYTIKDERIDFIKRK